MTVASFPPIGMSGQYEEASGLSSLFSNSLARIMGFSFFASLFQGTQMSQGYILDSARLLLLGSVIEGGRRFLQWLIERFRLQYSITAQFTEGDPAFEWIVMFLTEQNVWHRSRDFHINAKSSLRRWGIKISGNSTSEDDHADFVPTYELPHLFRWRGFWIETRRNTSTMMQPPFGAFSPGVIHLTIYTLNVNVLKAFVEEARLRYIENGQTSVIVHTASQPNFGPGFVWDSVKRKLRRPLNSIILEEGMMDSIVQDAREFIEMEDWYIEAGIPHRRGYLLYGPPGTGKTSTIHALAGELGMEIFCLSLSAGFVDDAFLQQAASSIPKKAIFLIEDIDCAFTSRDEEDTGNGGYNPGYLGLPLMPRRRSSVTLSGLLNVIDGIGSEEGVLFFATTNYIDRLDPALLRPGRIDRKIPYKLTSTEQAIALFSRFFPPSRVKLRADATSEKGVSLEEVTRDLGNLAAGFAKHIPENEFSTAELQGYLLSCKVCPEVAATGAAEWVAQERKDRHDRKTREEERKAKELREREEARARMMAPIPCTPASTSASGCGNEWDAALNGKPVMLTPPASPPLGMSVQVAFVSQEAATVEVNASG